MNMDGENFTVNIDCSKILSTCEENQYKMFVDTKKMSIVYEFVEWIRWMFSIPDCIHLTFKNSVIHELEDIQVLNQMNDLEIKPCGLPGCVHKRHYRTLLKDFHVFVPYKNEMVHKCLYDKIIEMKKKNAQRTNNFLEKDSEKHLMTVVNEKTQTPKKESGENQQFLYECRMEDGNNTAQPVKDENPKPITNKRKITKPHPKPFSLGGVLDIIRKNSAEEMNATTQIPVKQESFTCEDENYNGTVSECGSLLEVKKRRIRRRKRPRKNSLNNSFTFNSSNFKCDNFVESKSESYSKPNHIRFDDNDFNIKQNQSEMIIDSQPDCERQIENNCEPDSDSLQLQPPSSNLNNHSLEFSDPVETSQKLNGSCDFAGSNIQNLSFEKEHHNNEDDLYKLLKDKFKNATVVKRF